MHVGRTAALSAGIPAGRHGDDYTAMTSALVGISIPDFFLRVLLLLVFSFGLNGLLPSSGWVYLPGTCPTVVCQESLWGIWRTSSCPPSRLG
jgi:ABC-type dipeptide/oligopeptide/nickel transport system permease component